MALEIDKLCPTCGSKLDAHQCADMSRCTECRRLNPTGFLYCGYCATPMETAEVRGKVTAVAAPDGGWPNLSGELVQVKFYLQQGRLDEAYDLLSILQRRYPGHPELADFHRTSVMQPDSDIAAVVDEVLANSAKLTDKIARRQAPTWKAPKAPGVSLKTMAHELVPSNQLFDEDGEEITIPLEQAAKRVTAQVEAEEKAKAKKAKANKAKANKAKPNKGATKVYRTVEPPKPPKEAKTGHTVAVPTLQPATPYEPSKTDDRPAHVAGEISDADKPTRKLDKAAKAAARKNKKSAKASRKRPLKRATRTSRKVKAITGQHQARKPFGDSFGAGVLSRFGR